MEVAFTVIASLVGNNVDFPGKVRYCVVHSSRDVHSSIRQQNQAKEKGADMKFSTATTNEK
jgi:hypothetical protein